MTSKFEFVWIDNKRYSREVDFDGNVIYGVQAWFGPQIGGRGVWRTLSSKNKHIRAKIDEALDKRKVG